MPSSTDFFRLSELLDRAPIATLVGDDDPVAFEAERGRIVRDVAEGRSTQEEGGERLATLVGRYPELAAYVTPVQSRGPEAAPPTVPRPAALPPTATATMPESDRGGPPPAGTPSTEQGAGSNRRGPGWSPDFGLTAFKELVTAIIGLAIIGFTLYMTVLAAGATNTGQMTHLRDLLTLLLGLSGVVLGYYFGRVPGEARAASAEQRASVAEVRSRDVSENAERLAESLDDRVSTMTRGGSGDEDTLDQLRQIRGELYRMSRAARG
jgi:hypothetical protein